MSNKIAIIGYSGHGYVVTDSALSNGITVDHYCEKVQNNNNPFHLKYLGWEGDKDFAGWGTDVQYILGVGDNKIRHRIGDIILLRNESLLNVFDATATISRFMTIGVGNFVARQASINAFAVIGNFCILNTGCIIEHECILDNGVHIAPGAVLSGNVKVGEDTFIGANAVIKQGVSIGKNVIIGAGSVIIRDVSDNQKVVGNPGRIL